MTKKEKIVLPLTASDYTSGILRQHNDKKKRDKQQSTKHNIENLR
jgi:hypothetical protein